MADQDAPDAPTVTAAPEPAAAEPASAPQFDLAHGMPDFDAIPRSQKLGSFDLSKGMPSFDEIAPQADAAAERDRRARGHIDNPAPQGGDYWDHFYTSTAVGRVLGAVGQGFGQGWGSQSFVQSDEAVKMMRDIGIYNDYAKGQSSLVKSFNEALIRPYLAPVIDLFLKTGSAGLGAFQAGAEQAGREVGQPLLGRDIAAMPEAFFGGGLPEGHFGFQANAELRRAIADAQAIDHSEAAYFGQQARTPPTVVLPDEAQMEPPAAHPGAGPAVWDAATGDIAAAEKAPPDVHALARDIDPATMTRYDALSTRRDTYRTWIADLDQRRRAEAAESPQAKALQEKIDAITGKVGGVEERLTKAAASRVAAARADLEALTNPTGDSPDMARVRAELVKADQGMRDLAPDVSAAYREAEARMGETAPRDEARTQQEGLIEKPQETAENAPNEPRAELGPLALSEEGGARQIEPPVPEGHVRFYHGGENPTSGGGRWVTPHADYARNFRAGENGNTVHYVDIPKGDPTEVAMRMWDEDDERNGINNVGLYRHMEIPEHWAQKLRPLDGDARAEPAVEPQHGPAMPKPIAAITDDVTKKLVGAGRPQAEADAAAQIIAAHYDARAARLGTTALDLYRAEAPDIRSAEKGGPGGLAAGKTVLRDGQRIVTLFGRADASTFMHETGHVWLRELLQDAADARASDALKADAKAVLGWIGAESPEALKPRHEEAFARGFEQYLYEGRAPTPELAGVFAQFRSWLLDIYGRLKGVGRPIGDDIRDVFDRLIAQNPERQEAPRGPRDDLSAIHEADAESVPPQHAEKIGDLVEPEKVQAQARVGLRGDGDDGQAPGGSGPGAEGPAAAAGARDREPEPAAAGGAARPAAVGARAGENPAEGAGLPPGKAGGDTPRGPNEPFPGGDPALVDKAGNIRLDNLNSTADVNEVLKDFAEQNGMFMDARRGVVSSGEILDFADAMGVDASEINIRKLRDMSVDDGVPLAARIVRGRQMLIESAKAVHEAMNGSDEMAYATARDRHLRLQETLSGVTAEWGRAGRAFGMMKAEGDAAAALSQFLTETTGRTLFQIQEEMKWGRRLRTAQQVSNFVHNTASTKLKNAIIYYYVNALISGPITHARYAVGNAVDALWTPLVETPFGATVGIIKGDQDRPYFSEIMPQLMALGKGSVDGLRAAADAFVANQSPPLPGERVGSGILMDHVQPIPGAIGTAIGVPGRSVAAIHSFFKSLRYEQNIQALAVRTALREGLEGDAFAGRVAELTMRPSEVMIQGASETRLMNVVTDAAGVVRHEELSPEHMANVQQATQDSLKQLYMAPTDYNSVAGALTRVANSNLMFKVIAPFMKIGTQITTRALETSPLAPVLKAVRDDIAKGGAAQDMAIGRMAAGTALMGATALMVAQGLATGDGPTDPAKRAVWLLTHHPNSLTIGDISVPYQGLGRLGMVMRFAANMTETAAGWSEEEGNKLAISFMEGITRSVLDETFMRGVKDFLDAVYHPVEYGGPWIKSFATNWLPYSVGLSQVARQVDPFMRETSNVFPQNIFESAWNHIPVLSESLFPRRDFFGEPIPSHGATERYANDPVVRELQSLQIGIGKLDRSIRGVKLTEQQYDDFSRIAGRYAKMHLDLLVQNPGWSGLPAATRTEVIHKLVNGAREAGRAAVMAQYPQIVRDASRALAVKRGVAPEAITAR